MPDPFIGEIRIWGGTFAPVGWHHCDGTILPVNQHQALFSLIGNYYGGNGTTNFALPDLRGRVPLGFGVVQGLTPYPQVGMAEGTEEVTLLAQNLPPVSADIPAYNQDATIDTPAPQLCLAKSDTSTAQAHSIEIYSDQTPNTSIKGGTLPGSSVPFNIRQPLLSICFIIAMQGEYPERP